MTDHSKPTVSEAHRKAAREIPNRIARELDALRKFKRSVDTAMTAGLLMLSGEIGPKIPCHQFLTDIKVAFRHAETEYMEEFGAEAIRNAGARRTETGIRQINKRTFDALWSFLNASKEEYEEVKDSQSQDIPVEFIELHEACNEDFTEPIANLTDGTDSV